VVTPRSLGGTSLRVSPIGLGCWQFSQGEGFTRGIWAVLDQTTIDAIVAAALDGGITWFDTAEMYGGGRSEVTLSTALHHLNVHPGRVVLADKWLPVPRTAASISATIDDRLAHLQGYPIGLYQIHQPWSFSSIPAQMRAMAGLVRAGKITAVGVSNFSARQMIAAGEALRAQGVALASNQVPISLLDRRVEASGVLAAARDLGVTLIAYSPLAQGLLTGKYHDRPDLVAALPVWRRYHPRPSGRVFGPHNLARIRPLIEELRAVAATHDASIAQVALAWLVTYYGETVVAIPGATRPEQAAESAAAMDLRLSVAELARIDRSSRLVARR
jgi:aryl-alcohol dehydrogenase-like predicted oxidoreductase